MGLYLNKKVKDNTVKREKLKIPLKQIAFLVYCTFHNFWVNPFSLSKPEKVSALKTKLYITH